MRNRFAALLIIWICMLSACNPTSPPETAPANTQPPPTATLPKSSNLPTPLTPPTSVRTPTEIQASKTPEPALPLFDPGPYFPGRRQYSFMDTSRKRPVDISVWYPAVKPEGYRGSLIKDGEPVRDGAPYPVILCSTVMAQTLGVYVVSHGFVIVSIDKIDTYRRWTTEIILQPQDILFALNQVAAKPLEGLEGMLDTDRAGAMGYSFDGTNSLHLSGARVDPQNYLDQCADPEAVIANLGSNYISWGHCDPFSVWDTFIAAAGEAITTSQDGLWQPMTDPRILAAMPMAPDGWLLFGKKGLAAVNRPVFMVSSTRDTGYSEHVLIYQHLGVQEKTLVTFIDRDHMMILNYFDQQKIVHFINAFFGYYLQGDPDLAYYFSEEFIGQFEDLAYGPVPTE